MNQKKKFYAYIIPSTGAKGVCDTWAECEKHVKGIKGSRFQGFKSRDEAAAWLAGGAAYRVKEPAKPGIYFDAGTGRGDGVEINVTDHHGKSLLELALPKSKITKFGTHGLWNATNNYGELLACKYAIEIAEKTGIKTVYGDSKLIIDYWSRGIIKRRDVAAETVKLADAVVLARRKFETAGGRIARISGDDNPADLGFHR
ncbi:MAG: ribonuclease H family protein [bacterium]|nr:ribonuclease H family protein [bacterium]